MQDITDWLHDVLDDDERVARAATPGRWGAQPGPDRYVLNDEWEVVSDADGPDRHVVFTGHVGGGAVGEHNAAHIARHDPTTVLADIEANRATLDAYTTRADLAARGGLVNRDPLGAAVRALARAYRHKPGWQPEWEA
jgi:hypothetical protein